MFYERIDKRLDEAVKLNVALPEVCRQIKNLINLFIGQRAAGILEDRFQKLLDSP